MEAGRPLGRGSRSDLRGTSRPEEEGQEDRHMLSCAVEPGVGQVRAAHRWRSGQNLPPPGMLLGHVDCFEMKGS